MGQSVVGGSFRRGLNSEVITFSTRLAVQSSPLFKSNGKKSKMKASYFCVLPSDWHKRFYSSIQVQFYGGRWTPGEADNQVAMSLDTPNRYPTNNSARYYGWEIQLPNIIITNQLVVEN